MAALDTVVQFKNAGPPNLLLVLLTTTNEFDTE